MYLIKTKFGNILFLLTSIALVPYMVFASERNSVLSDRYCVYDDVNKINTLSPLFSYSKQSVNAVTDLIVSKSNDIVTVKGVLHPSTLSDVDTDNVDNYFTLSSLPANDELAYVEDTTTSQDSVDSEISDVIVRSIDTKKETRFGYRHNAHSLTVGMGVPIYEDISFSYNVGYKVMFPSVYIGVDIGITHFITASSSYLYLLYGLWYTHPIVERLWVSYCVNIGGGLADWPDDPAATLELEVTYNLKGKSSIGLNTKLWRNLQGSVGGSLYVPSITYVFHF